MPTTETFEITFRGTAGPVICEAFGEYALTSQGGRTVIHGPLRDQADLHAVLERVFSLGLEIVDVHVAGGTGREGGR